MAFALEGEFAYRKATLDCLSEASRCRDRLGTRIGNLEGALVSFGEHEKVRLPFSGWPMAVRLVFFKEGRPKEVDIAGGPVEMLCDARLGFGGTGTTKASLSSL